MLILRLIPIVGLLTCLIPADAQAQITGTLRGTVTDAQGAVLPGVNVSVKSPALMRADVFDLTNSDGRFRVVGLPAGTYEVLFTMQGFATKTLGGVRVGVNDDVAVDVSLELATVQESVTVTGTAVVDVTEAGLSQAVTTETIENMPLNGRQFLDLVGLVAGTAPRPATSQQGSAVTVFGERSITNSFLVDGMENNDDFTRDFAEFYIQDVIQEFKVEIGGYQAEFGRASGAVANVITKSGTNQFRGRGFFFFRDDALDSSNVSGQDPPELRRTETGGYLGGPIVPDRTWFFAAFQHFKETRGTNFDLSRVPEVIRDGWFSPTVGNLEDFAIKPVVETVTAFGKVNHQFGSKNQFFATVNLNLGDRNNFVPTPEQAFGSPPPGSIALPSTASDIVQNSYSVTARNTTFINNSTFLDSSFRYLRNRNEENTNKTPGAEQLFPGTFNAANQVTFWLSNATSVGILDRLGERYQWAESLSLFRDDGTGRHDFKVGFDINQILLDRTFLPPQTMIIANTFYQNNYRSLDVGTVELQRTLVSTEGDRTRTQVDNTVLGLFAQDSWELTGGIAINAGLRYDYASLFSEDKNNVAPRVGIIWDPGQNGRTAVRSSFGVYFDQNILELATAVPELGGLQFTTWAQQVIPRGASTFDNPSIGAFGPLQAGGTRWLANPQFFSFILPAGAARSSGGIRITGQGRPYIVYELLGIPVDDPRNPPLLRFDSIQRLTNGRLTPDQAVAILNAAFPGPGFDQFAWDAQPPEGSILDERYLLFKFRTRGPGISRVTTLQHPTRTPYTRSFNIGVEQQIWGEMSIGADLFVRRSRDLLAGRVINLRPQPIAASCLGNTVDGSPCNNQLQYIGFLDANVFTLSVNKRLSHRHQFLANYTYTDATDNFSTLRVPPKGGETSFLFSNQPEQDIGRSLNTPNHVFVVSGLFQGPWGVDVSGILKSASGTPFNAAGGGLDSDGDEIFDNRLIGTEKGEFETESFFNIDMRFAKEFRLGGNNLMALVEIFNLTNRANPLRINNAFGTTIGQTIEPLPGREIQFGLRFDWGR